MKNILEMLEASVKRFSKKTAFADENESVDYLKLQQNAKSIGTYLEKHSCSKKPVAILMNRSVLCLEAMMGILYGGSFYVVIDSEMPIERAEKIINTLQPAAIITDESNDKSAKELANGAKVILFSDAQNSEIDEAILIDIRRNMIDTDPAYAIFTSGSTGNPKGVIVNHRSVIAYSFWAVNTFGFDENTVFGNQTPFYFSMSVTDIYSTIRTGATLNIIPKKYFSFPALLIGFLNDRKVNTIYWVPSALSIVANLKVLDFIMVDCIEKVLFAGEVMPAKQLNYWRKKLPNALFANLFGPTETTDICTYYVVDREIKDDESVPIGISCDNCDSFIVTEDGHLAGMGEEGELYARGTFLAMGYYNDAEKTAAAFVQNPLNHNYPERVYKTGDLVKWNENGEMIYISRRDFQIKHMGYRIELGEIETAATAQDGVDVSVCIYDSDSDSIILVYVGKKFSEEEMREALLNRLPSYMMPQKIVKAQSVPYNQNGKTDRKKLALEYKMENK